MTETQKTSRMLWMDQLRGVAIILVFLQHTYTIPAGIGLQAPGLIGEFNNLFEPYRQPLLMFLSGMLLSHSLRKPWAEYANGKVRKVLWPLLVWTIPIVILRPPTSLTGIIAPSHLWFLLVLLACYAIGPVTRRVHPAVLAALLLAGSALIPLDAEPFASFYHFALFLGYGTFFMLGAATTSLVPRWQSSPWWAGCAAGLMSISTLAVASANDWSHELIGFAASALGIAAVVWVAPRVPTWGALVAVGERSIVWYVAHAPIMIIASAVLWRLNADAPGWIIGLLVFASAVAGCCLLDRVRVFRILFEFPRLRRHVPAA